MDAVGFMNTSRAHLRLFALFDPFDGSFRTISAATTTATRILFRRPASSNAVSNSA
jgi:hypothetical protein